MPQITDQMGRLVEITQNPQRIVSLVPSQTELLYYLGLENRVVGITRFCVHPPSWRLNKKNIGGTKKIDFNKIAALKPDLIIGNKEENNKKEIELLMSHYPVWMSDIDTLEQALQMIESISNITHAQEKGKTLIKKIKKEFEQLNFPSVKGKKVAYFIWKEPYMVVGKNCFITDILHQIGLKNVFENFENSASGTRYPTISKDDLGQANPELIFLSTEPYPFNEKHITIFKEICPQSEVKIVDGEMFGWYGSRLAFLGSYLKTIFK